VRSLGTFVEEDIEGQGPEGPGSLGNFVEDDDNDDGSVGDDKDTLRDDDGLKVRSASSGHLSLRCMLSCLSVRRRFIMLNQVQCRLKLPKGIVWILCSR
jgi:hypothetical protein